MYLRHILGKEGEREAEKYLKKNKYKILNKNFNCRQGEIDIIAKEKNEIVFVEVKTRTNKNYGNPIDAITKTKKEHLKKAIQYYLYKNNMEDNFIRVDAIEVYKNKEKYIINHTKNII